MKPRLTGLQLMTVSRISESLSSQMTSMLKFFMWERKHGLDFKFYTVFGAWKLGSQRLMRAIHKLSLVSLSDYKRSNHSLTSYIYKLFEHIIITLFKTSSRHTKSLLFPHEVVQINWSQLALLLSNQHSLDAFCEKPNNGSKPLENDLYFPPRMCDFLEIHISCLFKCLWITVRSTSHHFYLGPSCS